MKAHWSDILQNFKSKSQTNGNQASLKKTYENRIKSYEKAYASTELLTYNSELTAKQNFDRLKVGQGFYNNNGVSSSRFLLKPKKFMTFMNKLIVRIN
jgi:uncharacterized protein